MRRVWVCLCLVVTAACGGSSPTGPSVVTPPPPVVTPPPPPSPPPPSVGDPVVPAAPRLRVTRILAFGDSFTEGRIALSLTTLVTVPGSYPDRLRQALSARYTAQTIEVLNEGMGGEWAQDGVTRFASVMRQHSPQLVILLEGVNDIDALGRPGVSRAARALETMAKEARFRGAAVILAGYPPQKAFGPSPGLVTELNAQIRNIARGENATFVDLHTLFGSADTGLIGPDGLHPTPAGYERMAQSFFDAIRGGFEEAAATLTTSR